MPQLSRFFGIIIYMYYGDHLPPHFHVEYNEFSAKISIQTLDVIKGELPNRVLALAIEWAVLYRNDLMMDWELMLQGKTLHPIKPLI